MMNTDNKINLEDITFCIPVRIDSSYRTLNLKTLLQYLSVFFDTNYVILEADKTSMFKNDTNIQNISYIFIEDKDIIFHRTKYINQMLHLVRTPYAAIWDTDAITPIEQIEKAYLTLQGKEHTMVYPYSGMFIALNNLVSLHFSQTLDINCLNSSHLPHFFPYGFYSVGGAYMVDVYRYLMAGGENEHFYGWGPEDAERNIRIQTLELGVERVEGPMFHLFHTRGINSRDSSEENGIKNKKEFCKICGMSTLELGEYIKTWNWNKIVLTEGKSFIKIM